MSHSWEGLSWSVVSGGPAQLNSDQLKPSKTTRKHTATASPSISYAENELLIGALSFVGDPRSLVKALTRSVSGRHLQIWSATPSAQSGLLPTPLAGATEGTTAPYLPLVLTNGAGY